MKIEYIKMCGFGSYKDETVVEFNKFNDSGLFLITGPTGSGKTTIFDAIKYSLFGDASGENRESKNFRSKYADLDTPTYTEINFKYRDENYLIRRNPEYLRRSKNGKGTTKEKAAAVLYLPDKSVISGIENVKNKIVRVLGINEDQFSQIVMIAQGEFMKIILAKTDERGELFRKLFETEKYVEFQNKLKEYVSTLVKREKDYYARLSSEIARIRLTGNMGPERLEKIKSEKIHDDELDELLEESNNKTEKEIDNLRAKIKKIETLIANKDLEINRLEVRKKLQSDIVTSNITLKKKEEERKLMYEFFSTLQAKKPEIKLYEKKIAKFESELEDYNKIQKLSIDSEKFKSAEKEQKEKLEKANFEIIEYKKQLEKMMDYLEKNVNIGAELEIAKNAVLDKKREILNLKEVEKRVKICDEKVLNLKVAYADYLGGRDKINKYETDYNLKFNSYMDEQMGVISEKLVSGKPCPICGSVEHPSPYESKGVVVTQEAVKKAKDLLDKQAKINETIVQDNLILKEKALAEYTDILKNIENDSNSNKINELKIEQISYENVENVISNFKKIEIIIKGSMDILRDGYTSILEIESNKNEIFKLFKKYNLDKKNLNKTIEDKNFLKAELINSLTKLNSNLENAKMQINELGEKLEFASKSEAEQNCELIKSKKNKLEKEISLAEEKIETVDADIISLRAKIDTLGSQLDSREEVSEKNIDMIVKDKNLLNESKNKENELLEEFIKIKDNNSICLVNIKKFRADIEKLENEINFKKELSDVANGDIPGKANLKLETYIHITFFEQILRKANKRFSIMTNNQFELMRRKESTDKRRQYGLELDVVDHMNASTRPVSTLSGGESFKAALSLALGFSDVIQAYSSGIKINTMFIDEGFGSLDEESLANAVACLSDLSSQDVQIGIISHVDELKNRIERKIIVTKTPAGYSKIIIE